MTDENEFTADGEDPVGGGFLEECARDYGVNAKNPGESDDAFRRRLVASIVGRTSAGSLDDIRAQLAEFVYGAIPAGVHVEGLVLAGPVDIRRGWRKWALGLGMWLVRLSGCEVVKP